MEQYGTYNDQQLRQFLAKFLKISVWSSLVIALIGLTLFFIQKPSLDPDYSQFKAEGFSFSEFFQHLFQGEGIAVMTLGIICLILTPVMRVLVAMMGYYREKDRLYTLIAAFVLLIIIFSSFLGAIT